MTQFDEPDQEDFCPTPPQYFIGDNDDEDKGLSGLLDSYNTFVAELLLREADDDDPSVFFRENQAGIVVSFRDPPYSVCRCVGGGTMDTCDYINPLMNITNGTENPEDHPLFQISTPCIACIGNLLSEVNTLNSTEYESRRDGCVTTCNANSSGICFETLSGLYDVDGFSADPLRALSLPGFSTDEELASQRCGPDGRYEVGEATPNQEETVSVTVWYNNQVSYTRMRS